MCAGALRPGARARVRVRMQLKGTGRRRGGAFDLRGRAEAGSCKMLVSRGIAFWGL